jgi:hypothetical protein
VHSTKTATKILEFAEGLAIQSIEFAALMTRGREERARQMAQTHGEYGLNFDAILAAEQRNLESSIQI